MKIVKVFFVAVLALLVLSGCHMAVNKSVRVADGEKIKHDINAINGNVTIGDNCVVKGDCRSVNGVVRVGSNSETGDLQSVNGSISVGARSVVYGSIGSVNGSVTCNSGVFVQRGITSINGDVDIDSTVVQKDIKTHNGDVTLSNASEVKGDIIIKKSKGNRQQRRLYIRLEGVSIVHGDIINRDREIQVKVFISNGSKVKGRIEDAEVVKQEGEE